MKARTLKILDQIIYGLTLCYALVSCWELNTIPATFVSVALILLFFRHCLSPLDFQIEPRLKLAIGLYWTALLLSAAAAYPDVRASQVWSFIDRMLTLPLVLACCRTKRQLLVLISCVLMSLLAADILGLFQAWKYPAIRITSGFANPIHFGEHTLLAGSFLLPLALLPSTRLPQVLRYGMWITLLLSFVALIFNQTRAVWIAGSAVCVTLLVLDKKINRRFIFCVSLLCLVTGVFFLHSPVLKNRLISVSSASYQSNAERLRIWQATLLMIADQPVLGVGPDNFGETYQTRYILPSAKERFQRDAHNSYLSTAAELGIVGFFSFIFMFWTLLSVFFHRMRNAAEPKWPLAGLLVVVAFSVYGLMNSMVNHFWSVRLFWLLIGAALAGAAIGQKQPESLFYFSEK